jgi:hypothetical protein
MANNFLLLSTVGAIGWIFLSGPPEMKPVREPSRAAAASASSYVWCQAFFGN